MALPTLTGVARLIEDPELRYGATGNAVCRMRLAFNDRRKNPETGVWENGDVYFVTGVLFKDAAERAAESYTRQSEVVVSGRLKTSQYESRDGEKKSSTEFLISAIGASTRWDTVTVNRMDRASSGNAPQGGGDGDPWSTSASVPAASNADDDAPF